MIQPKLFAIVVLFAAVPTAAVAQDQVELPTDQAVAGSQVLLTQRLADQSMAYQRRNGNGARNARLSPSARATCMDKRRVASGLNPAKAQRLYSLCAQAGY